MSELGCAALGSPHLHLRKTGSTNDRVRELALRGAPHGTLVTAGEQSTGRGRHGRRWSAPPDSALLMSLLLRWAGAPEPPALLPLLAAVAICEVVGPTALVKWPNDVVVRRDARQSQSQSDDARHSYAGLAKLAGILIEGRPQQHWLVLGIGLNVAVDPAELPRELRDTAATMGEPVEAVGPTLNALLQALEDWLARPVGDVLAAWRRLDALAGSEVRWAKGAGRAEGIDDLGCLLVRQSDGSTVALDSGEVSLA